MEISTTNRCIKMALPNGKVVDLLTPVLAEIQKWIQDEPGKPERGGFIVGYKHKETGNISLEEVSHPYLLDHKSRVHFDIKDPRHKAFLLKAQRKKSFYMGVWHTHPQSTPIPSDVDWEDWNQTLQTDRTGCEYVFFIIAGTDEIRVWVGNFENKSIEEILECPISKDGMYTKTTEEGLCHERTH